MDIRTAVTKALIANELENNLNFIYRFTDPDGVRTGKSGYSFGSVQYDINNNPNAILCLRECGFTTDEIGRLKAQTTDIRDLNDKLRSRSAIVDKWDARQIMGCIAHVQAVSRGIIYADDEAFVHAVDYDNQFYMSNGGKLCTYLTGLKRPVTGEDIRDFKLSLPWGQKRPDDVERRYKNIKRIFAQA